MLPKIHKINNPGRPIVCPIGYHSTNISKFVDYHLQPIVKNIPSYVQDSNDFLNKIDTAKNIPANCLLVTMDVNHCIRTALTQEELPQSKQLMNVIQKNL